MGPLREGHNNFMGGNGTVAVKVDRGWQGLT